MSTIAVFGGTGETGKEVVYQALKQGQKVVVLARSPEKMKWVECDVRKSTYVAICWMDAWYTYRIPPGSGGENMKDSPLTDPKLTVIQGDVTKAADVDKVGRSVGR